MKSMQHPDHSARRRLLGHGIRLITAATLPVWGQAARAATSGERTLSLVHTHTRERIELAYAAAGNYLDDALRRLDRFLRDHYSGDVGVIDPQLFDQLHGVQAALGTTRTFEVISGYRCPATNDRLRAKGGGGVARQSLHMQGRAIDIRLQGVPLDEVRDAALSLRAGGVGYYPGSQFVHLDTGRVRNW
jgi:uncharacterized protein YcbK (DUF882 family)